MSDAAADTQRSITGMVREAMRPVVDAWAKQSELMIAVVQHTTRTEQAVLSAMRWVRVAAFVTVGSVLGSGAIVGVVVHGEQADRRAFRLHEELRRGEAVDQVLRAVERQGRRIEEIAARPPALCSPERPSRRR